ncbi:MAG: helicase HerA-like domain-containing protein [Actinomycetota bacterium]
MPSKDEFLQRVASGYAAAGEAVELGRAVFDGAVLPEAAVRLPAATMNRHGLIAGATGTGKTRSLQLIAEQLSEAGVPVFTADMKGDLSGMTIPAPPDERVAARVKEMQLQWAPSGYPVNFLALGGVGPGVPVRASVASFGPQLLGKVLSANETQSSSLSLVFHYARTRRLDLVDLADLRATLHFLTGEHGRKELSSIGGLSRATAGVLLRKILELQEMGADAFFGEPEFGVDDLLRSDSGGRGVISCLELPAVQDRPRLFSTFMMWLLQSLFDELPEVGDLPKPKLVFFFDEAHLLFSEATKSFVEQVAQTVRLIRSKGVAVFFVTHYPDDIPEDVLGQLGSRIQHALRAFTPRDARALQATVTTYPKTEDYDLEEDLTKLGTGEAMVTVLSETGAPTPVVWTRMRPPKSLMGAVTEEAIRTSAASSDLWPRLSKRVERESAGERIEEKLAGQWEVEVAPAESRGRRPRRSRRRGRRRSALGSQRLLAVLIFLALVAVIVAVVVSLSNQALR